MAKTDVQKHVLTALEAAKSKKAEDIAVLELPKESSAFTDYFLLCSGSNPRQVQAISDEVEERLSKAGVNPNHREGYDLAEWVLLDYVDYVVHIFSENARKFYDLERLWKSAKRVTASELKTTSPAKSPRKTASSKPAARKTAGRKPASKPAARKTTRSRKG